jgi:hypothetical protein
VDESKTRENLLRVLRALSRFQNVRLLATSRNYYDIQTTLADISMCVDEQPACEPRYPPSSQIKAWSQ